MEQSTINEITLDEQKRLQFIPDLNNDVVSKPKRIRSQKQKENDLKLGDRLKEFHSKKRIAKEASLRMKQILDEIDIHYNIEHGIDILRDDITYNVQELINDTIQKELDVIFIETNNQEKIDESINQAIDIIDAISEPKISIKKTRGRPKKIIPIQNDDEEKVKEFFVYPAPEKSKDDICCNSN